MGKRSQNNNETENPITLFFDNFKGGISDRKSCFFLIVFLLLLISSTALAGYYDEDTGWFYSEEGYERYNPATGEAEYQVGIGQWVSDENYSSNGAYLQWGDYSGSAGESAGEYEYILTRYYNNSRNVSENSTVTVNDADKYTVKHRIYTSDPSEDISYNRSDLPEWDWNISLGGTSRNSEIPTGAAGEYSDSDSVTTRIGINGRKDQYALLNQFRYEITDNNSQNLNYDSKSIGYLFIPLYYLAIQEENGINFAPFGIIDIQHTDYEALSGQWRMDAGLGMALSHVSMLGLFQLTYAFNHNRNLNDDIEITGEEYINIHAANFQYTFPLTQKIFMDAGLIYTKANNIPAVIEDDSTELNFGINFMDIGNWNISGSYFDTISGDESNGLNLRFVYSW